MTIKTILYIVVVPLSIYALDSLNLNNNHEFIFLLKIPNNKVKIIKKF